MKLLKRATALMLIVVAHAFLLNLGEVPNAPIAVAYIASVLALWAAAFVLWRRTVD